MNTTIKSDVAEQTQYRSLVATANEVLTATVGRAPHPPTAVWSLNDNGDPSKPINLELVYFDQSLSSPFSIEELLDTGELRYRFCRIWGKLIRQNNRDNLQHIVRLLGELREDLRAIPETVR